MKKNNFKNQKGVAIYLVLVVMAIFLDLSLGLSMILFAEILNVREIDYSVIAFYAADSGIEEIFYKDLKECTSGLGCNTTYCESDCLAGLQSGQVFSGTMESEAKYVVGFEEGATKTASSTGSFQETRRAIQVDY
ncbi:MAG: hypothetical protein NTU58_02390 [Candidatus Nealsonbacteria bacterium]|nr:hypothetical protein [Candidatus Nealsonbacteria bacterium]